LNKSQSNSKSDNTHLNFNIEVHSTNTTERTSLSNMRNKTYRNEINDTNCSEFLQHGVKNVKV